MAYKFVSLSPNSSVVLLLMLPRNLQKLSLHRNNFITFLHIWNFKAQRKTRRRLTPPISDNHWNRAAVRAVIFLKTAVLSTVPLIRLFDCSSSQLDCTIHIRQCSTTTTVHIEKAHNEWMNNIAWFVLEDGRDTNYKVCTNLFMAGISRRRHWLAACETTINNLIPIYRRRQHSHNTITDARHFSSRYVLRYDSQRELWLSIASCWRPMDPP